MYLGRLGGLLGTLGSIFGGLGVDLDSILDALGMILGRFGVDVGPILDALGMIPFELILNFHRTRCCCPSPAATPLDSTLAASKNECLDPPGCGGLREAISVRGSRVLLLFFDVFGTVKRRLRMKF